VNKLLRVLPAKIRNKVAETIVLKVVDFALWRRRRNYKIAVKRIRAFHQWERVVAMMHAKALFRMERFNEAKARAAAEKSKEPSGA
jgi:hypothetical protein